MSNSIKLHKEYGLNPTLCTCFYCGKETGEIAMLGANYKGKAPMHMCTSIEPCKECREKYKDYVLLVEVEDEEHTAWGSIKKKPTPTGRWLAIKKGLVNIQNNGVCYIRPDDYKGLVNRAQQ